MTKRILILTVLTLLLHSASWAYDFEAVNDDGVTIYDNITSEEDLTVEVTYLYYGSYSNGEAYNGDVSIPETVTYSGSTYGATSIGISTFYYCTDLTSITIPNSVTEIGYNAFSRRTGLTSVTSLSPEPPTCGSLFYNVDKSTCVLYVPEEILEAYSTAYAWEDFLNIVDPTVLKAL